MKKSFFHLMKIVLTVSVRFLFPTFTFTFTVALFALGFLRAFITVGENTIGVGSISICFVFVFRECL